MSARLSLQVVTWNSTSVVGRMLTSLRNQKFRDYSLVVIDNASTDKSLELAKKIFPEARIIQNKKNLGFSSAHNQGIASTDSEYIGIVNPDIEFTAEALEILLEAIDRNPSVGSISGKLLKNGASSGIIDAAGLQAKKNREFLNRGEGEPDHGQFDQTEEVFGFSGAFVIFRRKALESVRIWNEYFDEDFFAYKEDADIAWRLLIAGWKNWYEPRAILYHERAVSRDEKSSVFERRKNRSPLRSRLSYRNHLLLLLKNDSFGELLKSRPNAFWYELKKFCYLLFFERQALVGLNEALRLRKKILKKRDIIQHQRKRTPSELRHWFQ